MKHFVLNLAVLLACANATVLYADDADGLTNGMSAGQIVEQMRGLDMQPTAQMMADGSITPKEQQRQKIVQQLRLVGKASIPALTNALGDSDVQMRRNAELVMITLAGGYDGQPKLSIRSAVPALIKATEDKDSRVREWAAHALAEAKTDAKEAVPALIILLDDPDAGARNDACMALGDIGPAANTALPALKKRLNDANQDVRQFAKQAMKKIQNQ